MFIINHRVLFFIILAVFIFKPAFSQKVTVSGTVYDITKKTPMQFVSVISTSGIGTVTDSAGNYSLTVNESDSLFFSYLNKSTPKYYIKGIENTNAFNISIQRKIKELPEVFVKPKNYSLDSLQNRLDYQKIFDYKKPGFKTSLNPYGSNAPVGLDLDEFINMFKFKKNKRMLAFQRRLEQDEKEKFIDHRFNKGLVRRLTSLTVPQIDSFMSAYRPTFEMAAQFNDLELGQYIVEASKYYKAGIKINKYAFKKEQE